LERQHYYSSRYRSYHHSQFYGFYGIPAVHEKLKKVKWDPKWLDAAIDQDHLNAVCALHNPKNKRMKDFVTQQFVKESKRNHPSSLMNQIIQLAIDTNHPDMTDMLLGTIEKSAKRKTGYYSYWLCPLVSKLPGKAAPRVQKLIDTLPDRLQDELYPQLQTLKSKKK